MTEKTMLASELPNVENSKKLLAAISHNLKGPLTVIKANAELLTLKIDMEAEKKEQFLSVIVRKCDKANQRVDEALELIRKLVEEKEY